MDSRKDNKVELGEAVEDPIIYRDALEIIEHLIAIDIESLSYKQQKMNPRFDSISMPKHEFHQQQVTDIKLKYSEQDMRYQYLDSIEMDLLADKNKDVTDDASTAKENLYHLRQKYRLRIYRSYFKNVLNVILKSNSNQNLPNNIKKLFLVNFALMQDLRFNLMAEEKRFLANALLEQRMRSHNTDELYQSNVFQTQHDKKVSLYNEQYARPFFDSNMEGLTNGFLSYIANLQAIPLSYAYEQYEVLDTYQDLRQSYKEYRNALVSKKLDLAKAKSEEDIDVDVKIGLSLTERAQVNFIEAWQRWLDKRGHKNEKSILQPLALMECARNAALNKTADAVSSAPEYLEKLTEIADELVKKANLDLLRSNITSQAKELVTSVGSSMIKFLDKHWKTLAFITGGIALGLLAISLCACTGGLSMLAFGIVHLVHVAPVVAKLFCVVSAVVVGGGVGYGGKKASDCCADAGHEAGCDKDNKADAIPVVYRSEVKTPEVSVCVEQAAASMPEKVAQPGNPGASSRLVSGAKTGSASTPDKSAFSI